MPCFAYLVKGHEAGLAALGEGSKGGGGGAAEQSQMGPCLPFDRLLVLCVGSIALMPRETERHMPLLPIGGWNWQRSGVSLGWPCAATIRMSIVADNHNMFAV